MAYQGAYKQLDRNYANRRMNFLFPHTLKKQTIFNKADCFLAAMMAIKYGPFQTGSLPILFSKWIFLHCNSAKTACQFISLFSLSIDSEKVGKGEENRVSRPDCWPVAGSFYLDFIPWAPCDQWIDCCIHTLCLSSYFIVCFCVNCWTSQSQQLF